MLLGAGPGTTVPPESTEAATKGNIGWESAIAAASEDSRRASSSSGVTSRRGGSKPHSASYVSPEILYTACTVHVPSSRRQESQRTAAGSSAPRLASRSPTISPSFCPWFSPWRRTWVF